MPRYNTTLVVMTPSYVSLGVWEPICNRIPCMTIGISGVCAHLQEQPHHLGFSIQSSLVKCRACLGLSVDLNPGSQELSVGRWGVIHGDERRQERKAPTGAGTVIWSKGEEGSRQDPEWTSQSHRKAMRKWGVGWRVGT